MKKKNYPKSQPREKTRPSRKKEEIAVSGWNACLKLFESRPQDILRVYFSKERSSRLRRIKRWCSDRRLPYRQLKADELSRAAASVHHEGIVMVTRPITLRSTLDLLGGKVKSEDIVVALDQVSNTHNLGSILRTAAFFGVKGLVMGRSNEQAALTPSAIRMAEGALENVPVHDCRDLASFLRDIQATGVFVLGTDPKAKDSLYDVALEIPCVLVLGNEGEGLSPSVKRRCDALVCIPGTGQMQSLNVSVSAGILLTELFRMKNKKTVSP